MEDGGCVLLWPGKAHGLCIKRFSDIVYAVIYLPFTSEAHDSMNLDQHS